jgi:hypothetical protein
MQNALLFVLWLVVSLSIMKVTEETDYHSVLRQHAKTKISNPFKATAVYILRSKGSLSCLSVSDVEPFVHVDLIR